MAGLVLRTLLLAVFSGKTQARAFWSSSPATLGSQDGDDYILKTGYPVGNGRLGAMQYGPPGSEHILLNVDSLWSGGPFESSNYTGGNPSVPKYTALPEIRELIFQNGTGNVDGLLGNGTSYGSYRLLGDIGISMDGISNYISYKRTLDLNTGTHTTTFGENGTNFNSTLFCTYPDKVCVYNIASDNDLPAVSISIQNDLMDQTLLTATCGNGFARMTGYTQAGPPEGMKFDAVARAIQEQSGSTTSCSGGNLTITPASGQREIGIVIGAGTNYDQTKGNAENMYSFKGADPCPQVDAVTSQAAAKTYADLLTAHIEDYQALHGAFELLLPDPNGSAEIETASLIAAYSSAADAGDPFLEALLFDYARYLLIASSRENSLPANLQGRWAESLAPAWSGDYHANINLQMNYWVADQTGLGRLSTALRDYMEQTWVPRGRETARLLYDAPGWVVHNEMNIFGHTAMKEGSEWANYPLAPAWMMQHVWNHYDYTRNATWLRTQGYPLLKGVAEFWLSQLQDDAFTKDGTLVVNPCNSPEHGPTTFGCAHYQQEIHHVFEAVLSSAAVVAEPDAQFLSSVKTSLGRLDKGLHFTSWGGVKEWKLPDAYGYDDNANDTHRHLSHLTGWFPGHSIAAFQGGYGANASIQAAVRKTLIARGNGTGDDADAGWAKVWRAACWARLNATTEAYSELRYAIDRNFAGNGFGMYSGVDPPFQIDANFGIGGAVLSMLVVDLMSAYGSPADDAGMVRTVVLGPAIPSRWAGGSVKGLRIRGGGSVDFSWNTDGVVNQAVLTGNSTNVELVNVRGEDLRGSEVAV
ncbi:Six-hairpin glycosidase-like protein [Xylariomycetidae sp. FL2044]|nr:Six-hairpin glycosidase-like protein [Xylariomycetidae sp. FL2044]